MDLFKFQNGFIENQGYVVCVYFWENHLEYLVYSLSRMGEELSCPWFAEYVTSQMGPALDVITGTRTPGRAETLKDLA